jgi:hypothetical protein
MAMAKTQDNRRGVHLSVRVAADIHEELIRRAALNRQSVTNAVDRYLAIGLDYRSAIVWGGPAALTVFEAMATVVRANPRWLDDPDIFAGVREQLIGIIDLMRPNQGEAA